MDIIFKGKHSGEELVKSLSSVMALFKEKYHVPHVREVHLTVTLVDEMGQDVELVDNQNSTVYRIFEVYREDKCFRGLEDSQRASFMKLVVDNTKKGDGKGHG